MSERVGRVITKNAGGIRARLAVTLLLTFIVALTTSARGQYLEKMGLYLTGFYGDVTVQGHNMVAIQGDGLVILDITDPAKPAVLRQLAVDNQPMRLTFNSGLAYVLGVTGLQVIDLSDMLNPRSRGFLPITNPDPNLWMSIDVAEGRAYVARDRHGVTIVDVSDPDHLKVLGQYAATEIATMQMVKARGNYVYLSDGGQQTLVLDVTDPATPVLKNTIGYGPNAIVFENNLAYTASSIIDPKHNSKRLGLQILDLSDPTSPTLVGHYSTDGTNNRAPLDLTVAGGRAYMADLAGGMLVFDVSNPAAPAPIGSFTEPNLQPVGIVLTGSTVCLLDGMMVEGVDLPTNGLYFLDVSNPATPQRKSALLAAGSVAGVTVSGTMACLSHGSTGVSLVDVKDPIHPVALGQYDTPGEAQSVALANGLAYVADGSQGLQVLDVSDPSSPTLKGAAALAGTAMKVTVASGRAYVAVKDQGMDIVDVSNPAAPVLLGGTGVEAAGCLDVAVAGNRAFVPTAKGLSIYDVSNPAQLSVVGSLATPAAANGVALLGNLLAVALADDPGTGIPSVLFLDVQNPAAPQSLGQYARPWTPAGQGVALADGLAAVAFNDGLDGHLSLVDTTLPVLPTPVGGVSFNSDLNQVALANGLLYVATGTGLTILRQNVNLDHVQLLAPNQGSLLGGTTITVNWKIDQAVAGDTVKLELLRDGVAVENLGTDQATSGTSVKTLFLPPQLANYDYRVRVTSVSRPDLSVDSLDPLTITGGPLRLVSPNGGETLIIGQSAMVEWLSNPNISGTAVKLALYKGTQLVADLGEFFNAEGHGFSKITVPAQAKPGADYTIKMTNSYDGKFKDASDGPFTLKVLDTAVAPRNWAIYQ